MTTSIALPFISSNFNNINIGIVAKSKQMGTKMAQWSCKRLVIKSAVVTWIYSVHIQSEYQVMAM